MTIAKYAPYKGSIQGLDNCGICLENFSSNDEIVAHDRQHSIHKKCIQDAVRGGIEHCPFCRAVIDTSSLFSWKERQMLAVRIVMKELKEEIVRGTKSGIVIGGIVGVALAVGLIGAIEIEAGGIGVSVARIAGIGTMHLSVRMAKAGTIVIRSIITGVVGGGLAAGGGVLGKTVGRIIGITEVEMRRTIILGGYMGGALGAARLLTRLL